MRKINTELATAYMPENKVGIAQILKQSFNASFKSVILLLFLCGSANIASAQTIIEGYVFESGNRGYLETASVTVLDNTTKAVKGNTETDKLGKFEVAVAPGGEYLVRISKKPFEVVEKVISTADKSDGEKVYAKFEMIRLPGYVFEVTLAPARSDEDVVVDAITGAWIEVYNNTTDKEVLSLKDHPSHTFSSRFEQGNHYTILIRKKDFFNKRLEAYVNVKGCILCFDGVGEVKPGVSDVLTEGFAMGTLLANVEMQPVDLNKEIEINNIYYDLGSARLKTAAREELDQLSVLLKDNKNLLIEIGSHTDSRGDQKVNQDLSLKRAKSVVDYLTAKGIPKERMVARGYGESKLRNRCADGVECSERKHLKNRRTEFKVLGFVHNALEDNRTLVEMKEGERMEKLLAELGDSEIKIAEGEELPEELKRQLAKQNEESVPEAIQPIEEVMAQKPMEKRVEKQITKEVVREVVLPAVTVPTQPEPEKITPKVEVQKKPAPMPGKQKEEVKKVINNNRNTIPTNEVEEEFFEEEIPAFNNQNRAEENEAFEDMAINEMPVGIVPEREIKKTTFAKTPKKLPMDYYGYKVQIVISTFELPLSHEIFSRHGNLLLEETNKGTYAYLLGDFKQKADADDFMNNVLSRKYANARVVQYMRGRRVVN